MICNTKRDRFIKFQINEIESANLSKMNRIIKTKRCI